MTRIAMPRLVLRRYTHADIPDILAFAAQPSVSRATPEIKTTEAGVKHYIDKQNACLPFEMGKCFDLADDQFVYAILADEWKRCRVESEGLSPPPNRPWLASPPGHGNQITALSRFKGGAVITTMKRDLIKACRRQSSR